MKGVLIKLEWDFVGPYSRVWTNGKFKVSHFWSTDILALDKKLKCFKDWVQVSFDDNVPINQTHRKIQVFSVQFEEIEL